MKLSDDIRYLKGIGEKRAELFHRLGVFTIQDLLYHLPRGYEDRTDVRDIADLQEGESVCVRVYPASGIRSFRARTGARVTQLHMSDGTGIMNVTWFNSPYIGKIIRGGGEFVLFGRIGFKGRLPEMINPVIETESTAGSKTGKIVPIYPCTAGLSQRNIRESVEKALAVLSEPIPEVLPAAVRQAYKLMPVETAIRQVHTPPDFDTFEEARRRLAFEEFFVLQIGIGMVKTQRHSGTAPKFGDVKCIAKFAEQLPFELTGAQKRVINEICADLIKDTPMNRLVQGDVGSGKTIVAAAVMLAAVRSGYQAALMAPTEILAKQHYEKLIKLFEPLGIKLVFLSGSQRAAEKRESLEMLADGRADIAIGTHALITDDVSFKALGLAVTDEQHRFGVRQRSALTGKGKKPHTLVMTATPIPRTLSLILYGDLDISVIDELPAGRRKIQTIAVGEESRKKVDSFVLGKLDDGRQAYFVCPLIEESEVIEANAVSEYAEKLKKGAYRGRKVEVLHGRMKAAEKDEIMRRFANGEIEVLVSTTVIEVGVDVPNAAIMVIENAERFGLSQLHQLRGRVGRGEWQSYCILFCASGGSFAKKRMEVMCKTDDGFKIAEKDLELRGPGEFLGTRQSGLPELRVGDIVTDMQLLKEAKGAAETVLKHDARLESKAFAPLRKQVEETFEKAGGILN